MRLFPTSHADILVDNDYIMASLGVLSKKHRQGAIKLLEKSLGFKFPEKKERIAGLSAAMGKAPEDTETRSAGSDEIPAALRGVAAELAEKDAQREELIKHIEECEAQGYDMTAYREDLGLPIPEGADKVDPTKLTMNNVDTCDHNCRYCSRTSCPNRNREA